MFQIFENGACHPGGLHTVFCGGSIDQVSRCKKNAGLSRGLCFSFCEDSRQVLMSKKSRIINETPQASSVHFVVGNAQNETVNGTLCTIDLQNVRHLLNWDRENFVAEKQIDLGNATGDTSTPTDLLGHGVDQLERSAEAKENHGEPHLRNALCPTVQDGVLATCGLQVDTLHKLRDIESIVAGICHAGKVAPSSHLFHV